MTDLFLQATRRKFRFPSNKGDLSVDQKEDDELKGLSREEIKKRLAELD